MLIDAKRLMGLALAFAVQSASADAPNCAVTVDSASFSARGPQLVTGFLGQRLYLHAQHPDACNQRAEGACKATAYVVSGDKVLVGEECGGWTAARFSGKGHDYYGWVQSERLGDVGHSLTPKDTADTSAAYSEAPALCVGLRDYYQADLEGRTSIAPFQEPVPSYGFIDVPKGFVPAHGFDGDIGQIQMTPVTINGRPAKLAHVRGNGMCAEEYTELWSADLSKYFGEASGRFVVINGKTFLLGFDRERIEVLGFHSDLDPYPVCAIALRPRRPEQVSIAVDVGLCQAVRRGQVEDVGLSEITPLAVEPASFGSTLKTEGLSYEFFRQGSVDLTNDGHVERVAMVRSNSPPAGCGTSNYVLEWPEVLNARGLPDVGAPVNRHTQDAGSEEARLIRYQGRIYVESRSLTDQRDSHRVSEIHRDGIKTVCSFTPVEYVVEKGAAPTAKDEAVRKTALKRAYASSR